MSKYYRALQDSFLWKEGAILKYSSEDRGYSPIEDVWDNTPHNGDEYITKDIIEHENNKAYFERVYKKGASDEGFITADEFKKNHQVSQ